VLLYRERLCEEDCCLCSRASFLPSLSPATLLTRLLLMSSLLGLPLWLAAHLQRAGRTWCGISRLPSYMPAHTLLLALILASCSARGDAIALASSPAFGSDGIAADSLAGAAGI